MPDVRMPDGTIIRNVPEGTTRSQLQARIDKAKPDNRPTSFLRGAGEGVMKAWNNAARVLETGADKIGVSDAVEDLGQSLGLSRDVAAAEQVQNRKSAAAPTRGSGFGRFIGEVAGTIPATLATKNPFVQGALATGLLTERRDPKQIAAEMAVGGVLSKGADVVLQGVGRRFAEKKLAKAVPTVEALKKQAGRLYTQAQERGVTASKKQTQTLASKMKDIAAQEGLISPTGRVSSAYPKAREALDLTNDFARGKMTPKQMQTVRKVLSEAAGSPDNSERRIAQAMLGEFDDWTAPLAPELSQARAIARRYINAGKLETAKELAGARAGQFTGSGFENALRTEYRGLDRAITKGKERGFTPEAVKAIQDVARGTKASNTARNVGKLAPTGVVSMGLGTGVPFLIGNALGGPTVGAAAAGVSNAAGLAGRKIATDMGIRNANLAELIVRQGGALPQVSAPLTPEIQALNSAIIAALAQNAAKSSEDDPRIVLGDYAFTDNDVGLKSRKKNK